MHWNKMKCLQMLIIPTHYKVHHYQHHQTHLHHCQKKNRIMKQYVFSMSVKPSLKFSMIKLLCQISRNILKGFKKPTNNFLERSQFSQVFKNNLLVLESRLMRMGRGLFRMGRGLLVDIHLILKRLNGSFSHHCRLSSLMQ